MAQSAYCLSPGSRSQPNEGLSLDANPFSDRRDNQRRPFVVGAVWLFWGHTVQEYVSRTDFDSVAWRESANTLEPVRIRMIDDLLESYDLASLSESRLLALLGEPTETAKFSDWDLVYWLGPERGWMSIDSEWLVINISEDGNVSEWEVVRD